ncbi:DUF6907 domain-containing protein [Candidatus Blastococcus massiliensis]|uniref:DUF6907 domain-containing protein n=1 Tax=Candidatus Blastococcus massiliensis TaxID=1470358 RepID=UPI0004B1A977|nr:hypothetical protein [Candidatus Blastococcus massiliensis]
MSNATDPDATDAHPCPPWCDYQLGCHLDEWDIETATGLPIRFHETTVTPAADAPVWAYLFAEERIRDGARQLGAPMVAAGVDEFQDGKPVAGLTAQEARTFAGLLLAAADLADQLAQERGAA